ncbi:clustered mitochondria-domain-containing protein [Elsinoe ampelina]|uniref:Clustered mitochondria protein homolog n=1 Tax=Elsinoe ampelina TaxID=302913 RepID=A0A6A6GBG9_9PEZI|nr:clustered mitochondria-domain-containing protein [Elsinoe ampelina]
MAGDGRGEQGAALSKSNSKEDPVGNEAQQDQDGSGEAGEGAPPESVFQLHIKLPHEPGATSVMCSTHEQVQDIRQSIIDLPFTFQYSCFHLEHQGKRINDFVELSEVPGIVDDPHATLVEDPYTDSQARMHFVRVRELIGASGDRTDLVHGVKAGLSLHDSVSRLTASKDGKDTPADIGIAQYELETPGTVSSLLPPSGDSAPKTVKSVSLSPWNPPPYSLRAKGHLMYIVVTTNEGEQHNITSHVSGFFVNKSTNQKFDPFPRSAPKGHSAHSLLNLLGQISPSFESSFKALQEFNAGKDPLASFQLSNAIPSSPWAVSPAAAQLAEHVSDITRTQEPYLLAGPENAETLRDWNEEFQSTRELPKETVQDRVFRERLTSKLFAEYNEAAVRGAVLVARGEVAPLNPTEGRDAQIFVYNNVFYSFGADGVGTFASDGGDDAARAATGKDVMGVKAVNQLDIQGLFTPGTVVVDYLGKRLVGQSIVPGIFKQREPGEHQIDYGGVEGKDVIAEHEGFKKPFAELSKSLRVKKHPVWDKEGKRHDLEGSVETKGLLGTDGRKYVLDLYRITPLDVAWLDEHRKDTSSAPEGEADVENYPHRMAVLRPELVESYWRTKLQAYVKDEVSKRQAARNSDAEKQISNGEPAATNGSDDKKEDAEGKELEKSEKKEPEQERVDVSGFQFSLNPDVCCGQKPQTEEEKEEWANDEAEVQNACKYLRSEVIPKVIHDLSEGDVGFPMDGQSLSSLMHKRGINIRYLGVLANEADKEESRLQALKQLCHQEMVSRSFKHVSAKYLKRLSPPFAHACIAHLLNCLLGTASKPVPELDESLKSLYPEDDYSFMDVTPDVLASEITAEANRRYRYDVGSGIVPDGKRLQMLREVSLKLGLQLEAKDYFDQPTTNGHTPTETTKPTTNGTSHKKKSKRSESPPAVQSTAPKQTFHPDDVVNVYPIIKEASPRSVLAEEALEAGRISIAQDQKELGQELLLESLSLHEQIYGILHPEVARVYYALSTLYYSLEEKNAAVELARKATIISERTLGVDHAETILCYLNLSLFEHANGNTKSALGYVRHALDLWKVIYGPSHPDSITTLNNAAVMLQSLKLYHESRIWFESSLSVCESVSGKNSVNTATLLFQLAQALALDRDPKGAVNRMREAFTIFKNELGPEDRNTKEAESWLESLTSSAVSLAKHAKDVQARRLLIRPKVGGRSLVGATEGVRPQPSVGQTVQAATGVPSVTGERGPDSRSVDELLKYINGEAKGSPSGKKKGGVNPKRRQAKA